jgi:tRNA dimethylallyltransferase
LAAYKTILIAGPTASGKSRLAIELAKRGHGVIINTDSMQVYRDLRIVTARPSLEEELEAQHRLYGFVNAGEAFSTGAWLRAVAKLLPFLQDEFETVIFVGGTGLYFRALTSGLSEVPETPIELREKLRDQLKAVGPAQLYRQLLNEDAGSAANLESSDGQRIIRALEVLRHTGRPLRMWQKEISTPLVDLQSPDTKAIVLEPERDLLAQNISKRFDAMVRNGALDEVSVLISRKLDRNLPAMKAIGVAELRAYLEGQIPLVDAINSAVIASRQYAKRQRTWFRGQMDANWLRFNTPNGGFEAVFDSR